VVRVASFRGRGSCGIREFKGKLGGFDLGRDRGLSKEVSQYIDSAIRDMVRESMHFKEGSSLLTIDEASKLLNVKVSWLRQAVFRREIKHVKLGALVRFRVEDLHNHINRCLKDFTPLI